MGGSGTVRNEYVRSKRSDETRRKLIETFMKLMADTCYGDIGITRITEESGISRKSFYYHFASKKALLDYVIESMISEYISKAGSVENGWSSLEVLCRLIYRDRRFFKAISDTGISPLAVTNLNSQISPLIVKAAVTIFDVEEGMSCCTLASDAIFVAIIRWMSEEKPCAPPIFLRNLRIGCMLLAEGYLLHTKTTLN